MAAQRIILSTPPELRERIRAYRFAHRFNTEAEAIRALIETALDAADIRAQKASK